MAQSKRKHLNWADEYWDDNEDLDYGADNEDSDYGAEDSDSDYQEHPKKKAKKPVVKKRKTDPKKQAKPPASKLQKKGLRNSNDEEAAPQPKAPDEEAVCSPAHLKAPQPNQTAGNHLE